MIARLMPWATIFVALAMTIMGMGASTADLEACQIKHSAATCYHAMVR
jgi:ABC-type uncharacterized transport system permease subunit